MEVQSIEQEIVHFLNEKERQGVDTLEIIKELKSAFSQMNLETKVFVECVNTSFSATHFPPLIFAEMAKAYYENPNDVAVCIRIEYSTYSAVDVGKLLLQPTVYPDLKIDEMNAALTYARFSQNEVETAIEELYSETTLGYVVMLDTSGSMTGSIGQIKIDTKAFVALSKYKDQFGINKFNNSASWVYPSNNDIVTVDKELNVLSKAAEAIEENITSVSGLTNMGKAIELGNEMIKQANTDLKAFVILSDGEANIGESPDKVLGNEPPIFVAGLGRYLKKENFETLLNKNPESRFYWKPDAIQMMEVFNDIRGLPSDVAVTTNTSTTYNGSNYQIIESVISEEAEEAQFSVVWTDSRCQYTSSEPSEYNINVVLYDPTGKKTDYKPQITGHGYCVFNVYGARPGVWKTLIQYSVPTSLGATSAAFEFDTLISLDIEAPSVHKAGVVLPFTAKLLENGKPIENVIVQAKVTAPQISINNALVKYQDELKNIQPDEYYLKTVGNENIARLHALRMEKIENCDILPVTNNYQLLKQNLNGHFEGIFKPEQAGAYNIEVTAKGINSVTNKPFSRVKLYSVLVG